jgi:hypothetical protein
MTLLEQAVGVESDGNGQLDHQVQECPLVFGPTDRIGLVDLRHGRDGGRTPSPQAIDSRAQV